LFVIPDPASGMFPAGGTIPGAWEVPRPAGENVSSALGDIFGGARGGGIYSRMSRGRAARGRFALGSRCLRWGDIPPGRSPLRVVRWAVLHGTMGAWVSLKETTFAKKGGRGAGGEGRGVLLSEVV
jgi:hypothetical protein